MEANNKYQVIIDSQNHQGDGVVRINNVVVFVEGGIKGDEVEIMLTKVQKNFAIGKVIKIITPSKFRTKPICPIFNECGGCEIMHFDYRYQLDFKKQLVIETLNRLGDLDLLDSIVEDVVGMEQPYFYRNKVQVPLGIIDDQVVCGFYKKKSHEIVPFENCFIQPHQSTEIVKFVRDFASENNISIYDEKTHSGILRHVMVRSTSKNEYMVVIVTNSKKIPFKNELIKKLKQTFPEAVSIIHNINQNKTNVILGQDFKVLDGNDQLIEEILGLKFQINHQSFLQINLSQTIKMYQKVIELLNPTSNDIYIDAFCGVGTMSLLIAKVAKKVYGIEIVEDAIKNANINKELNMIDNVEFMLGKAEEEIFKVDLKNVKGIIIDPPRKGCEAIFLEKIIGSQIDTIVYVSCNVATLARDLKILKEYYNIKKVIPFDLFSQTSHVETVVLITRV